MRLPPILLALFVAACAGSPAPQVTGTSQRVPPDSTTPARVQELLSVIAADSMEGRAVWSAGSDRAARYIAAEMAAAGLVPAGDSGYFQRIAGATRTVVRPRRERRTDSTGRTVMAAV